MAYIGGRLQSKASRQDAEADRREAKLQELFSNIEILLQYHDEMANKIEGMNSQIAELERQMGRVIKGGLSLLRNDVIRACSEAIDKGEISIAERSRITEMYKIYHDEFSGNGEGEYYYNAMLEIPVVDGHSSSKWRDI
ncbi:MAG: hypothetical protein ACI4P9_04460 [Selenomonadaceae bacterium]